MALYHSNTTPISPQYPAVGTMAGLVEGEEALHPALSQAAAIERLASSWLPLQGPNASDEERGEVKDELFGELKKLNEALEGRAFLGPQSDGLTYGDVVVLPAVLKLWQYVLGEDIKGELGNVKGWIERMCADEKVIAGIGGALVWWWVVQVVPWGFCMACVSESLLSRAHCLALIVTHCIFSRMGHTMLFVGVTRCKMETYIYH
jgi:hypothetical protein